MRYLQQESMNRLALRCFVGLIYVCATIQFVRYYVTETTFYLDMPRYLVGKERLPFQDRILPIFLMWPINHSSFMMNHLTHESVFLGHAHLLSAASRQNLAFYLLSLVSFSIASFLVVRLYRLLSRDQLLSALVFPVFMVITHWTYVVHLDANFSYPYDMPSLAFFAGGLLAIYSRRFLPLVLVMFFGTMNRETTLFLLGIYVLHAATRNVSDERLDACGGRLTVQERFSFGQVSWGRAAILLGVWLAVKLPITYYFRANDHSENIVRIVQNTALLRPRMGPTLLNICGYLLPIAVLLRRRLRPLCFANYLYILPVWFAVMFYTGVIQETRVYGELNTVTAIAVVLILEEHVRRRFGALRVNRTESNSQLSVAA